MRSTHPTAQQRPAEPVIPVAGDHSILDRWNRVVEAVPEAPALAGAGVARTFRETDRTVRTLAHRLAGLLRPDDRSGAGVGPEGTGASVPVGIMAGHTTETVVGMLALVAAGRTVVVLDDHLPEARLQHVVTLAGIAEVLADRTRTDLAAAVLGAAGSVHDLDALIAETTETAATAATATTAGTAAAAAAGDTTAPAHHPGGADPAAIVFTSGSTGLPKGVAMTHRQLLRNAEQSSASAAYRPGDRVGVVLPLSFAAGILTTLDSLLNGAAAVLLDARDLGTERLLDGMTAEQVTAVVCTPHLLRSIVATVRDRADGDLHPALAPLRFVMTVGEPITGTDVHAARPVLGARTVLWNGFGSSEMGAVTYFPVGPEDDVPAGVVPAGYTPPGKTAKVLREDGTAAAVGETGQLVVVSDGMTAGYWGAPEKTAEHLGVDEDGTPLWRQGDLARIEEDGCLVLLGRDDDAVKVRGYLVEPSEVEAALRAVPDVHDVVVTALVEPPAMTRLVAYVVGRPGRRTPAPAALRRALRDRLPEYMVPAAIVPMPELPRNERGKVDRSKLPGAPSLEVEMVEGEYDQWELVVGQIWAEVLGLRGVHLDEDFTALGGDSLSAEEMLAIVHTRLGVDLRASELLEQPTLRAFARRVRIGAKSLPSHPDVVKVAEARETGRPPVFCLSGAGALGLTFLPLSRYLPEHDVYAFQQHGLERRAIPDWSIQRTAKRTVELMRIVQPRGPYLLVGHSLGGLVALEVAKLLTEGGERVEHVAILDTYLPRSSAEQAQLHFGRMEPAPIRNTALRAAKRALDRAARRILPAGVPVGEEFAKRVRAYGAGVIRYGGQKDFDALFDQASIVTRRHTPSPYAGPATFVLADGNPDVDGWGDVLRGDTTMVRIESEHSSLLREPHVAELAAALRSAFTTQDPRP
ncbi:alpha/beta fold hydrolase [Curtobacterium pusillum]|uniref:alpha/beta fold hydrolase n=1 Tax=Curtobacterium pusillum TaxID=69373 RepID=UPI0011A5BA1E|nr:alpha/beta fold hydrolase [Curtobacterium pusillum]